MKYRNNETVQPSVINWWVLSILVSLLLISPLALAFDYYSNKPMVFIYQKDNGKFSGCGPTQCLFSSETKFEDAFDLVDGTGYGSYQKIGEYGRCHVYQTNNGDDIYSYDKSVSKVLKALKDRC